MPEGPELYKAAQFLNHIASTHTFTKIRLLYPPSDKRPAIPWDKPTFNISCKSRGKEIRITLSDTNSTDKENFLLTFGMTGRFKFTKTNEEEKHSMLMFDTSNGYTFSFVDYRHFGRWYITDHWSELNKRGPCIITEYKEFRAHVLGCIDNHVFDKPVCEVMLDQRYFSCIGNYLRAEILYRMNIDPFLIARKCLEGLKLETREDDKKFKTEDITTAIKKEQRLTDNGETDMFKSESYLVKSESGLVTSESNLVKSESGLVTSESNLNKIETDMILSESNLNKSELDLVKSEDKTAIETKSPDLLLMCHKICWEVINLKGSGKPYDPDGIFGDSNVFEDWLQCYTKDMMINSVDSKGRTMWHSPAFGKGKKRRIKQDKKVAKTEAASKTPKFEKDDMCDAKELDITQKRSERIKSKKRVSYKESPRSFIRTGNKKTRKRRKISENKRSIKVEPLEIIKTETIESAEISISPYFPRSY